jgi:DNA processing protein
MLPGVGGSTLRALHASGRWHGQADQLGILAIEMGLTRLAKALETPGALRQAEHDAAAQVKLAMRYGTRILSLLDEEFPPLLAASRYNPFLLYVRGNLAQRQDNAVAIIGTRKPTEAGRDQARLQAVRAVEEGRSVISGLALGCDSLAHKATVDAGGHTVAVMAHGLHTVEPARHQDLARAILDSGGALVSHYPFGTAAEPRTFVQRDAIQAGLSDGVVLIQSDLHGGSLHACRAAMGDGRWVWAAPVADVDREMNVSAIQANLVVSEGEPAQQRKLLKLADDAGLSGVLGSDKPWPGSPPPVEDTPDSEPAARTVPPSPASGP